MVVSRDKVSSLALGWLRPLISIRPAALQQQGTGLLGSCDGPEAPRHREAVLWKVLAALSPTLDTRNDRLSDGRPRAAKQCLAQTKRCLHLPAPGPKLAAGVARSR